MLGVPEGEDHLVNYSVNPDSTTDQLDLRGGWIIGDEEVLVETM